MGIGSFFKSAGDYMASPRKGEDQFAPSRGSRLAALLHDAGSSLQGGQSNQQAQLVDRAAKQRAQAAQQARLEQLARESGLSPEELLAMELNPEKFGAALATGSESATLAGGSTRVGRHGPYTAPLMGHDGGYGYTQTPDGFNVTGQRPQSYQEIEANRQNQATEELRRVQQEVQAAMERQRLGETARANRAREGLGWANHNERKRQHGFGTPGVGSSMGPDSDWEDVN